MNRLKFVWYIACPAIVLIFLGNFYGLGITGHDDAVWHLGYFQPGLSTVSDWATAQGRLYALIIGPVLLYGSGIQGTYFGNLIEMASFTFAILLFALVLRCYFNTRLAVLAVVLFAGLFSLKINGSAAICYPLLIWPSFIIFFLSILAGRHAVESRGATWLVVSGLLFFASLFTHEAVAVTFVVLALMAWFGNILARQNAPTHDLSSGSRFRPHKQDWMLAAVGVSSVLVYVVLSILFMLENPTQYAGKQLDLTDYAGIWETLMHFSLSGSALFNLFSPYSINYTDQILQDAIKVDYSLVGALRQVGVSLITVIFGLLLGFVTWIVLTFGVWRKDSSREVVGATGLARKWAVAPGLVLIILPALPVAMTVKYQQWHLELGVQAYVTTVVSHFGVALCLAVFILTLVERFSGGRRLFIAGVLTVFLGGLGTSAYIVNGQIARDIRLEAARWQMFERGLGLLEAAGINAEKVLLPQFAGGSWFTVMPAEYWSQLALAKYGLSIETTSSSLTSSDAAQGAAVLTYVSAPGTDKFNLVAQQVSVDLNGNPIISKVAVELALAKSRNADRAVLTYVDQTGTPVQKRLSSVKQTKHGSYVLSNLAALSGSVHLLSGVSSPSLSFDCEKEITREMKVVFGNKPDRSPIPTCIGKGFLGSGWGPVENKGVWARSKNASITLAVPNVQDALELEFELSTLTGLGYFDEPQTVYVSVDGSAEKRWIFTKGRAIPAEDMRINISPREGRLFLEINLRVDSLVNLSRLGLANDTRDLGVHLHSVTLR